MLQRGHDGLRYTAFANQHPPRRSTPPARRLRTTSPPPGPRRGSHTRRVGHRLTNLPLHEASSPIRAECFKDRRTPLARNSAAHVAVMGHRGVGMAELVGDLSSAQTSHV